MTNNFKIACSCRTEVPEFFIWLFVAILCIHVSHLRVSWWYLLYKMTVYAVLHICNCWNGLAQEILTLVFVVVGWHRACCVLLPLLELLASLWYSYVRLPFATVLIHSNSLISKSLHLVYINLFSILFSAYLHFRPLQNIVLHPLSCSFNFLVFYSNTYEHLTLYSILNPLEHTAVCETAGLAKSVDTQPAVRRLRHRCLLLVILAFCQ